MFVTKKYFTMNFATTKQRILQYLDFKGISVTKFFEQTEIKRGFLDTDKLESAVSDINIAKIIATYNDLNIIWLLTGKEEMIINNLHYKNDNLKKVNEPESNYKIEDNLLLKSQKETIEALQNSVIDLRSNNQLLQKLVEDKVFG